MRCDLQGFQANSEGWHVNRPRSSVCVTSPTRRIKLVTLEFGGVLAAAAVSDDGMAVGCVGQWWQFTLAYRRRHA